MPPPHPPPLPYTQSRNQPSQPLLDAPLPLPPNPHTPLLPTYSPSASGVASHPVIHTYHPPLPPILTSPYPSPTPSTRTLFLSAYPPPPSLPPTTNTHTQSSSPYLVPFTSPCGIQSCRKREPLCFEPTNIASAQSLRFRSPREHRTGAIAWLQTCSFVFSYSAPVETRSTQNSKNRSNVLHILYNEKSLQRWDDRGKRESVQGDGMAMAI